jgi:hypothetical protein
LLEDFEDNRKHWKSPRRNELSDLDEQKELIRYSEIHCKNDFTYIERLNGRDINLLQGLELHTGVFNLTEQKEIVDYIYRLQRLGQEGKLRGIFIASHFFPFILQFNYTISLIYL